MFNGNNIEIKTVREDINMSSKIIYENQVKALGGLAETFAEEGMIIFFGDNAPDTLADYCYSININPVKEAIKAGQIFMLDEIAFNITAVGEVAEKNLIDLGHITVAFNGSTEPTLAGTICVEKKEMPMLKIGSKISILA
jgi:PTS system glucitol/sorbitol-specific IIA component